MYIAPPAVPAVVADFIFTGLALIIVLLRLATRVFMIKNVGAEDYLILVAMACSVGFLACVMLQIKHGLGRPVDFEEAPLFLQALWVTVPIYNLALIFCKLSIVVQCYRIFRTSKVQKFLKVYFVVLVIYGLWTFFSSIFVCIPVSAYWHPIPQPGDRCMNRNHVTYSNAALNIISDFIIVAVPIPLLRKLQIPRKQKWILMGVFGVGVFASVMSIVRLNSLFEIGRTPPERQSIAGVNIAIWSCIEINVGIMCASVPALKPMVARVFPKLLLSDIYSRTKRYYGNSGGSGNHGGGGGRSRKGTRTGGGTGVMSSMKPQELEGSSSSSTNTSTTNNKKTEIKVVQSFEMKSVSGGLDKDLSGGVGDDGKNSRDGSENGLVTSSWQADCYSTTGHNNRVVKGRELV